MNESLRNALHILALLIFAIAGIGGFLASEWPHRNRLIAWGLFFWSLSTLHV
jgi:hypothetical protein